MPLHKCIVYTDTENTASSSSQPKGSVLSIQTCKLLFHNTIYSVFIPPIHSMLHARCIIHSPNPRAESTEIKSIHTYWLNDFLFIIFKWLPIYCSQLQSKWVLKISMSKSPGCGPQRQAAMSEPLLKAVLFVGFYRCTILGMCEYSSVSTTRSCTLQAVYTDVPDEDTRVSMYATNKF